MATSKKTAPPKKTVSAGKAKTKNLAKAKSPKKRKAAKGGKAPPSKRVAARASLPSKKEIFEFLETTSAKAGKREIARAFGIKGAERIALKSLLREMT